MGECDKMVTIHKRDNPREVTLESKSKDFIDMAGKRSENKTLEELSCIDRHDGEKKRKCDLKRKKLFKSMQSTEKGDILTEDLEEIEQNGKKLKKLSNVQNNRGGQKREVSRILESNKKKQFSESLRGSNSVDQKRAN